MKMKRGILEIIGFQKSNFDLWNPNWVKTGSRLNFENFCKKILILVSEISKIILKLGIKIGFWFWFWIWNPQIDFE